MDTIQPLVNCANNAIASQALNAPTAYLTDRFASSRNAWTASNSFSRLRSMMMLCVPSASAT